MKKRIILFALLFGFGLVACQVGSFSPEQPQISVPTRLVLPTQTVFAPPTLVVLTPLPSPAAHSDIGPTIVAYSPVTITVPPSPTSDIIEPTPEPTRVGKYTGRARGVEFNEATGGVDSKTLKADFVVIYGGEGWKTSFSNYKTNVQACAGAHIPCLLLWDILLPPEFDASRPDRSFPPENEEPNIAKIINASDTNGISGVIIRFLDKDMPDHKVFTQVWMANYIKWMIKAAHNQTGKPVFAMTSKKFISSFGDAPELDYVVSDINGLCTWKAAWPEDEGEGIEARPASWSNFPYPPDDYVPEYVSGNGSIYFFNYARSAWKIAGITAPATPLWLYKGSAEQLKEDLGY